MIHAWVLVADMEASERQTTRATLAERVEAGLEEVRGRAEAPPSGPLFLAPPVTTKGLDEFSAVLRRPERAFDILEDLNTLLWPTRFRAAISWGEIDVAWSSGDASAMDGGAFHSAAEALDRARRQHLPLAIGQGVRPAAAGAIEAIGALHRRLQIDWSPAAAEVMRARRRYPGLNQVDLAERLSISQQAVSKAVLRASERELTLASEAIRTLLAEDGSPSHGAPE